MGKKANEVVEGEALDILVGNRPLVVRNDEGEPEEQKELVKAFALKLLNEKYGIEEEDFLSAELEVVPAGRARDLGFDRSMVLGYGQDDSVCAYTSLVAQLAVAGDELDRTGVCVLVDKEEIGSVGATGMASQFFENTIAEIMELAGEGRHAARCAARWPLPPCCPPTCPLALTRPTPAYSSRRTALTWAAAWCSTSTPARAASQATTTPAPSTWPASARSWTTPACSSKPASWAKSTLAAAEPSRTSPRSTAWTSSIRAWPCFPCTALGSHQQGRHLRSRTRLRSLPARLTYANTGSKKPLQLQGLYSFTHLLGTNPKPVNVSEEPEGARNCPAAAPSVLRYAQRAVQRARPGAIGLHSVEQIRRPAGRRNS